MSNLDERGQISFIQLILCLCVLPNFQDKSSGFDFSLKERLWDELKEENRSNEAPGAKRKEPRRAHDRAPRGTAMLQWQQPRTGSTTTRMAILAVAYYNWHCVLAVFNSTSFWSHCKGTCSFLNQK